MSKGATLGPLLLALVAASSAMAQGFTRDATVVLVTGVPGDVESERAYEDQLQRLLEALDQPAARPQRVFVLADAPERVHPPTGLAAEIRAATRASFLATAADAAKGPGPLVVMMWGHGGAQGTKPVFHVRGPRIDAADVAAFASSAGDRPSRWILYFRSSGAFAQALAQGPREILASEHQTAFRSDPVGMDLLVQAVRSSVDASLAALAVRVSRATVEWYETQRLARTEEPTLWAAGKARPLAQEKEEPDPALAAATPDAAARGPEWDGVVPVAARAYPDAAAVVLRRIDRYTLGESPALIHEVDQFVQVLTPEGEERGDVDVASSPPDERVAFLDCEVLRADGTLVRLPAEETREATAAAPASAEYPIPHRHRFSLPGVSPGAILRVHYRSEWRRFPLPHLFVEAPLAHDVPMLESRIDVRVGADTTLHHHVLGAAAREPAVEETPSGRVYTWTFSGVPAVADEALAPPDRVPRLLLSTFPDWGAFASWYRRLIQLADVVTPEIEAKAAELVRGKSSEREKVIALYEYVTSLRYVAVPLGVNSHRPHAAENVLRNRYGDCKDKANLFNTLLKTQGIPAHLVLVPRFGEANPAVPGLGFNHAISRVRVGGEWTFADTTDTDARFGLLPPGDPGRQVLVVDGQSTGLVTLPSPIPADHRLSLDVDVPASAEASSTLAVRALGFADYALRQVARAASGPGATRPVFAEAFRATAGSVGLQTQAHTAASALDREFEWRGEGRWVGLHFDLGGGHRGVFAPFWLPREWEAARHARRSGLFVNSGYPLVLDERVALALPSGAGAAVLPPARKNERAPLRYDLTWTAAAADRLEARLRVELTSGEIAAGDVGLFQDQLRDLLAAAAQAATYRVGP